MWSTYIEKCSVSYNLHLLWNFILLNLYIIYLHYLDNITPVVSYTEIIINSIVWGNGGQMRLFVESNVAPIKVLVFIFYLNRLQFACAQTILTSPNVEGGSTNSWNSALLHISPYVLHTFTLLAILRTSAFLCNIDLRRNCDIVLYVSFPI